VRPRGPGIGVGDDRRRLALLSSVADSESEELTGINVVSVDPKKVQPELLRRA
jgi:hypothetical protein